jgi:CRP-like cAMP-binding protein
MLSMYGNKLRPDNEINNIIEMTDEYENRTIRKWQKISTADDENIYIILNGSFEVRRESDNLCMFTLNQKIILGIPGIFYEDTHVYCIARSDCEIRVVPKSDFMALVAQQDKWQDLTKILACYVCLLYKRDNVLVARDAYSVVREFLLEINDIFHHHKREVNIYDYIQEYSSLARSTIVKILSELKKGDYIEVNKGRLLKIHSLPERF